MTKIENKCRLCLVANKKLVDIFDKQELIIRIEKTFDIQLYESANWPNEICKQCLGKLEQFWTFHELVNKAQEQLIEVYGEFQSKTTDLKEEDEEGQDQIPEETLEQILKEEYGPHVVPKEPTEMIDEVKENIIKKVKENLIKKVKVERIPKTTKTTDIDNVIGNFMKLECTECSSSSFTNFADLMQHYSKVHKIAGFVRCCQNKFSRRDRLYEHVLFHKNPNTFQCEVCEKCFASRDKLNLHKMVHLPEDSKKFVCSNCGMKYATRLRLKRHMLIHVPDDQKTHKCTECDKKFATNFFLTQHIRLTHKECRRYFCEICAKRFMSLKLLEQHQSVHGTSTIPRVKCEHCGKTYSNERTLKKHIERINDTEKIYQCGECNHIAPNLIALRAHQSYLHKKDAVLFDCNVCGRAFKKKKNLTEHMAGHTGEKLYTCLFCPKQFNSNANKYSHQKKNHPEEWAELHKKKYFN